MKRPLWPMPEGRAARLLIVDDHELTRAGIRRILADDPSLEVVAEAKTGHEAVTLCRRLRPDLVLMDVRMPDLDGLSATRAINREHLGARIILITLNENPLYLREALQAGAAGYVLKGASKAEIIHAVKQALRGQQVLPPDLAIEIARGTASESNGESGSGRGVPA
jgi:DNA-binding NarL/FixJ family response regulator